MPRSAALTAALLSALLAAPPARAEAGSPTSDSGASAPQPPATALEPREPRHPWRIAGSFGAGSAFDQSYFVLGARVGYELALGLVLDVEGQWWMGSSPSLGKLAPGLTWYAPLPFRPYVGAYYARWFIGSGGGAQDAVGGRAGVEVASAGPASLTVGAAYERLLSCSANCDSWWPEATVGLRF